MARQRKAISRRLFLVTSTMILLYATVIFMAISHRTLQSHTDSDENSEPFRFRFPTTSALDCSLSSGWQNYTTALSSYPRSGNTWLRTLIEKSTGYLTSSIYCDHKLRQTFRAECNKTNQFLLKTHYPVSGVRHFPDPQSHWRKFGRLIHLVRNPFDAIVSYHHFRTIASRTESIAIMRRQRRLLTKEFKAGNLSRVEYDQQMRIISQQHERDVGGSSGGAIEVEGKRHTVKMDRDEFQRTMSNVYWYIAKYRAHYLYWKSVPLQRIVVRYEDLRLDTINQLRLIDRYLLSPPGWPISNGETEVDEARLECAVRDDRLPYYSSTRNNNLLYGLDMLGLEATKMIIRELGPIICELGYGDLLNDREKSIDGRLININCTEYRTEEPIKDIYVS